MLQWRYCGVVMTAPQHGGGGTAVLERGPAAIGRELEQKMWATRVAPLTVCVSLLRKKYDFAGNIIVVLYLLTYGGIKLLQLPKPHGRALQRSVRVPVLLQTPARDSSLPACPASGGYLLPARPPLTRSEARSACLPGRRSREVSVAAAACRAAGSAARCTRPPGGMLRLAPMRWRAACQTLSTGGHLDSTPPTGCPSGGRGPLSRPGDRGRGAGAVFRMEMPVDLSSHKATKAACHEMGVDR